MSVCIVAVFAAMLEFALVNTLARKEIRRLSMRARKTEKIDANNALPSDMVRTPSSGVKVTCLSSFWEFFYSTWSSEWKTTTSRFPFESDAPWCLVTSTLTAYLTPTHA